MSFRYKEKVPQPRKFPSFRKLLEKIHLDLFAIERQIALWEGPYELSEFEMLVLVLEDKRFLLHDGVDLTACLRELLKAFSFRRHGGASTIDMQFVRTATGFRERTLRRKFYEIFLSVLIQFRYSKRLILRSYLQHAFFGSHLIGVHKAAPGVFGKQLWNLSTDEAAQLAAMLVYPKPLRPKDNWAIRIRRRADYGQRRMLRLKKGFEQIPRGK